MSRATGLDYGVLPNVMKLTGVPRHKWQSVFAGIRIMEDAALEEIRKK